ncbi:PREDICTED: probable thiol methyltransferase 2 [Camelina sativa]|uniref:Probable thiol methyltransferase 2 n=1 Tax=Camelina sativa TaxID=90675 RepID=A0ABM0ZMU1_CAMSA|nr:PREDICTED: probable thiol methyltransferase 2 [Camelina sativa]
MEKAAGKAMAVQASREIFQRLMSEDSSGGWEKSWEAGATPWDLGKPTPVIANLVQTGSLPNGRALVPGCGTGYDVVAMASRDRYVVGLDISKTAVERSSKMFSSLPNAKYFSFLSEDFFTWEPAEQFDLIFDYTFFCAFEPGVRPLWAQRMEKLLKPGGELITLMFPIDERSGGPPYSVSVSEYEKVLIPLGFEAVSIVDNELAIGPRKGMEKLGRWKKSSTFHSTL